MLFLIRSNSGSVCCPGRKLGPCRERRLLSLLCYTHGTLRGTAMGARLRLILLAVVSCLWLLYYVVLVVVPRQGSYGHALRIFHGGQLCRIVRDQMACHGILDRHCHLQPLSAVTGHTSVDGIRAVNCVGKLAPDRVPSLSIMDIISIPDILGIFGSFSSNVCGCSLSLLPMNALL